MMFLRLSQLPPLANWGLILSNTISTLSESILRGSHLKRQTSRIYSLPYQGTQLITRMIEFLMDILARSRTHVTGIRWRQYWPLRSPCAISPHRCFGFCACFFTFKMFWEHHTNAPSNQLSLLCPFILLLHLASWLLCNLWPGNICSRAKGQ